LGGLRKAGATVPLCEGLAEAGLAEAAPALAGVAVLPLALFTAGETELALVVVAAGGDKLTAGLLSPLLATAALLLSSAASLGLSAHQAAGIPANAMTSATPQGPLLRLGISIVSWRLDSSGRRSATCTAPDCWFTVSASGETGLGSLDSARSTAIGWFGRR